MSIRVKSSVALLVVAILCLPPVSAAQQSNSVQKEEIPFATGQNQSKARIQIYSQSEGLSQSSPSEIIQDANGFLWITTQEGLNRFDGFEFKVYNHEVFDKNTLSNSRLYSLHLDSKGHIWGEGADISNELDPVTGHVIRHVPDSTSGNAVSSGYVLGFLNDSSGNLWIRTSNGLNKFNVETRQFTPFFAAHPDSTKDHRLFRYAIEAPKGTLWAYTGGSANNRELYRIDIETGESLLVNVPNEENTHLFEGELNAWSWGTGKVSWFKQSDDTFWLSASDGISGTRFILKYDETASSFKRYEISPISSDQSVDAFITDFFETKDGDLWLLVGNSGPWKYDASTDSFIPVVTWTRNAEFQNVYAEPFVDHTNQVFFFDIKLWLDGSNRSLRSFVRFDPSSGKATTLLLDPDDPYRQNGTIDSNFHYTDADGHIWFKLEGDLGMDRYDPKTQIFTNYPSTSKGGIAFSKRGVNTAFLDADGVTWMAQGGLGLLKVDTKSLPFSLIKSDGSAPFYLNSGSVQGLYESQDGSFWVGSSDGLYGYLSTTKRFSEFSHHPVYRDLNRGPISVSTVTDYDENNLLIGSNQGAYLFNKQAGSFSWVPLREIDAESPNRPSVFETVKDADGSWWFGTSRGLIHKNEDLKTTIWSAEDSDDQDGPLGLPLIHIHLASSGILWGATSEGIYQYNPINGEYLWYKADIEKPGALPVNRIHQIVEDPIDADILWLASNGGGLIRFDKAEETFTAYMEANSDMPNDVVYQILADKNDNLWLSTNLGLVRFNTKTESFKTFGVEDGLQALEFNSYSSAVLKNGSLAFGGIGGINVFFPSDITEDATPPKISITHYSVYNSKSDLTRKYDGIDPSRSEQNQLRYDENDLTFSFAAMNFVNSAENEYSYRLEGYEPSFSAPSHSRTVRYSNLPHGEYVFRIEASNSDGAWTENGYAFAFEIFPPWWKTIWAYLAYAGLFGVVVFQTDRYQRRRLVKKEEEKARIERAELEAETASARASALQSENDLKELQLAKAKELEYAFSALQNAHDDLKNTQDQLVHSEKMASLGALTAGIAHEIKNPLNFINNFAEINSELADELLESLPPSVLNEDLKDVLESLKENSDVIGKHGKRADSIVRNMLQHASGKVGELEKVDFNKLIGEYVDLAYHGKRSQMDSFQSEIVRSFGEDLGAVPVVPQEFSRVILNLLSNAFDAVNERRAAGIADYAPRVEVRTLQVGEFAEVRVSDNGSGIKPEHLEEVFKPFFTTKATGSGTGLGLSMSYDIITKGHNGTMRVENNPDGGAVFVVQVPLS